jgi:DNA invertase Pin-like site-specific DNA recombinase
VSYRAVIVAAVSTPSQAADDHYSIPAQIADARAACERAGWSVVAEVVVPGHSRDYAYLAELTAACPEYAELIHLIERDQVDLVVCRHYDRLWRNDWIRGDVMRLCGLHRVQVYSIEQPKPPRSPETLDARRGLSSIMELLSGALSEEEQAIRVARFRIGMRGRIANGRHHSARCAPFGYRFDADHDLEPDPDAAPWLRWIFERRAAGYAYQTIANDLYAHGVASPDTHGPWDLTTIARILRNPVYTGVAQWGIYRNEDGNHEALIDPDLWQRASDVTRARRPSQMGVLDHWLRGLLYCGYCHGTMTCYRRGRGLSLRCSAHTKDRTVCRSNGVVLACIASEVENQIVRALQDPADWLAARQTSTAADPIRADLARLDAAIAENRTRWQRWASAYETGSITVDELVTHRARLDDAHAMMATERAQAAARLNGITASANALAAMSGLADTFATLPDEDRAEVASALIHRVYVRHREAIIEWR